ALGQAFLGGFLLSAPHPLGGATRDAGKSREPRLLAWALRREVVEGKNRRDRDCETERRLDQGLADAGGDRGESTRTARRDALEGGDDPEHGAEESHEGRHRSDRSQDGQAATEIPAQIVEAPFDVPAGGPH